MSIQPTNNDYTCYDNIIAPSRTDCECFALNPYSTSDSDLYLDELEGLATIKQALNSPGDCDYSDLWEQMYLAIQHSVVRFVANTNSKLQQSYKEKRQRFKGSIGQKTFQAAFRPAGNFAGVRLYCADVVSGYIKLNALGMVFNTTGTMNVQIWDSLGNLLYNLPDVATTGGQYQQNTLGTPIILPMHNDYVKNIEYYILYSVDTANLPLNNDIKCGSCGSFRPRFNINAPYFNTQTEQRYGWANYLMAGGVNIVESAIADVNWDNGIGITADNKMNGLIVDLELFCKTGEVICRGSGFDYDSDPYAMEIAQMIRLDAGFLLLNYLKSRNSVDYNTLINGEELDQMSGWYLKQYNEKMDNLIQNLPVSRNDCLVCKPKQPIKHGNIF